MRRLLASILLFASLLPPSQGWAATFGDTVTAGKSNAAQGQLIAVKFTAPSEAGTITKLSIYGMTTSSDVVVYGGIYADSSSLPHGALLASSGAGVTVTTSTPGWYDITLDYTFSANQVLWLAFFPDASSNFNCYQSAGSTDQTAYGFSTTYPTFPDPGNSASTVAWTIALYATYTPAGGVNYFPRRSTGQ